MLRTKLTSLFLVFAVLVSVCGSAFAAPDPSPSALKTLADNIALSYANTSDAWRIIDSVYYAGRGNAHVNKSAYLKKAAALVADPKTSAGTLALNTIALSSLGEDVTAFNGVNLPEVLIAFGDTLDLFSMSTALCAVTPISPKNCAPWVSKIIAGQMPNGAWGFDGKTADMDMTGMMLIALAPFKSEEAVKISLDNAVSFLSGAQSKSGAFASFGSENANSTEAILMALTSLGIDAGTDARFIKDKSLVDALMSFATPARDGFGYTNNKYNGLATEQGFRALASYIKFVDAGCPAGGASPYDVSALTGVCADGAASDANLASITVSGARISPWFDSAILSYSGSATSGSVTVSGVPVNAAATLAIPAQPFVLANGINRIPIVVTAQDGVGTKTYEVLISYTAPDGGGDVKPQTTDISISGVGGETILAKTSIAFVKDDTPYSVLSRAAAKNNIAIIASGSGSSVYVSSIGGLAELDHGARSGWMYSVNGVFIQKSAGAVTLKPSDTVAWVYTENLGGDVGGGEGGGPITTPKPVIKPAEVKSLDALEKKQDLSVWECFVLARADRKIAESQIAALIKTAKSDTRKVTDACTAALTLGALGYDAANIDGYDLLSAILNHKNMEMQGANGPIFALIAYDSRNYPDVSGALWSRDALIKNILSRQNADGGVPLAADGKSSVDITAMAITSLAPYMTRAEVKSACDKMVAFLKKSQLASGGFADSGIENSESLAQVIIAACAIGNKEQFSKNGVSLLSALAKYKNTDGTYRHVSSGSGDAIATEQALIATLAWDSEKSIYALPAHTFLDELNISSWALDAVLSASEKKIMGGTGGRFLPSDSLSRAQLAQLLVRALGLKGGDVKFNDVASTAWYADAVSAACAAGVMMGANGVFRPNDKITHEELAVVIVRAMKLSAKDAEISDISSVSSWAQSAVCTVFADGIMSGSNGAFNPSGNVTREMAAVVLIRALK